MKHLEACKKAKKIVDARIRYKRIPDSWDKPEDIYRRGYGDCQHYAICYMHELIKLDPYLENVSVFAVDIDGAHYATLVMDTQKPFWSFLPWVSSDPIWVYHVLEVGSPIYRLTVIDTIRRYEWRYNWKNLREKMGEM